MSIPSWVPAPSSSWPCPGQSVLVDGAVQRFSPPRAAVLQVKTGRLWVTLGGPYGGHANANGDLVLVAGDRLEVPARSRVVVEAWMATPAADAPAVFEWCETPSVGETLRQGHLGRGVAVPAGEVLAAAKALAQALGRLGLGVLAFPGQVAARWTGLVRPFGPVGVWRARVRPPPP